MRYLHCLHTNYSRTPIRFLLCISCKPPLRSPLLGIVSGSVAASLLAYAVFRVTMFPTQVAKMIDGSVGEVLTAPLISSGFTCVYGARGLRLLVMHDRHLRGRWIRVLEERAVIKGLVAAFLAIGGIAWSAILLYGLNRRVMSHRTDVGRDKNIFRRNFKYKEHISAFGFGCGVGRDGGGVLKGFRNYVLRTLPS